jgi:integral membrane protein
VTGPDVAEQARFVIGVRTALKRYRIMAYVVGIGLIVLVLIGVPLQYGAGIPQVAQVVGPIHGAMYIVYLVASVDLARRGQLATRQLAMIVLAGFVPLFAFVVERKITRLVEDNLAGEAGPE